MVRKLLHCSQLFRGYKSLQQLLQITLREYHIPWWETQEALILRCPKACLTQAEPFSPLQLSEIVGVVIYLAEHIMVTQHVIWYIFNIDSHVQHNYSTPNDRCRMAGYPLERKCRRPLLPSCAPALPLKDLATTGTNLMNDQYKNLICCPIITWSSSVSC